MTFSIFLYFLHLLHLLNLLNLLTLLRLLRLLNLDTDDTVDIVYTVDTLDNVKSVNSVDNVSSGAQATCGAKADFAKTSAAKSPAWNSSADSADSPETVSGAAVQTHPNTRRSIKMT